MHLHGIVDRGFSLVEVLVASSLTTIATLALAQLSIVSVRVNHLARSTTVATVLALQKMEQLRALTWTFDASGSPVSDTTTDTTLAPERSSEGSSGGTGLSRSPPDALLQNTAGYCDFLDRAGRSIAGGVSPPVGAAYVRRWSIEPLPAGDALVVQVSVVPVTADRGATNAPRRSEEVRLVGIKTRKSG